MSDGRPDDLRDGAVEWFCKDARQKADRVRGREVNREERESGRKVKRNTSVPSKTAAHNARWTATRILGGPTTPGTS